MAFSLVAAWHQSGLPPLLAAVLAEGLDEEGRKARPQQGRAGALIAALSATTPAGNSVSATPATARAAKTTVALKKSGP